MLSGEPDSPPTVGDVCRHLDAFAPPPLAAAWDNVGLLAGDPLGPAGVILCCLTLTPEVAAEAVATGAGLVVTHHPVLFRGAKRLTPDTPDGRVLLPLMRHGVAVHSPHTAFDNCVGGINDGLAARCGLVDVRPLRLTRPADGDRLKLAVFVPVGDTDTVADALFASGAGRIGAYEQCSFRTPGTGTFFGTDTSDPQVGERGRRERVDETRLEVVLPAAKLATVVAALRQAHRYEEPAFDIYPLRADPGTVTSGEGRVGELSAPESLGAFAARVKQQLRASVVQVGGDPARPVRRVALACGAAGEHLSDAIKHRADVFLTGELRFHDVLVAAAANVAVVLPGHYATERPGVEDLAARIAEAFPTARVTASTVERDPLAGV